MHDFYLAKDILKTVLECAKKNGLKNVSKARLELGIIHEHGEDIAPENLRHNFKLLAEKTIAKDSEIEIKRGAGQCWKLIEIEGE